MRRLLKTIQLEDGKLYATIDGSRILLAECKPKIEVYEDRHKIRTIGSVGYSVKKLHITLVLCDNMEFSREVDLELLNRISAFDLSAELQRKDGVFEVLPFYNLLPDELDLDGEWSFEVPKNSDVMNKLLSM
jgi:hypothetical protein